MKTTEEIIREDNLWNYGCLSYCEKLLISNVRKLGRSDSQFIEYLADRLANKKGDDDER